MPNPNSNFYDNVTYNTELSKIRCKPKFKGIGRYKEMTPDEVVERLKEIGITITRRTLLRWETAGLIPKATRSSAGRKGKITDYPDSTTAEAYASYSLMHGRSRLTPEYLSEVRGWALNVEKDGQIVEAPIFGQSIVMDAMAWLAFKKKAESQIEDIQIPVTIIKRDQGSAVLLLNLNKEQEQTLVNTQKDSNACLKANLVISSCSDNQQIVIGERKEDETE